MQLAWKRTRSRDRRRDWMGIYDALILKYNRRWAKIGTVGSSAHIWERRGGLVDTGERRWGCKIWVRIKSLNLFNRSRCSRRTRRRTKWNASPTRCVSNNSMQIEMKVCWLIKLNVVSWSLTTRVVHADSATTWGISLIKEACDSSRRHGTLMGDETFPNLEKRKDLRCAVMEWGRVACGIGGWSIIGDLELVL